MTNNTQLTNEEMYLHFYQHTLAKNTQREVDFLEQICPLQPGDTLLDIPCGYGRHALELAQRRPDVAVKGFDISPRYIAMAKQTAGKNAEFSVADMRTAPLPQGVALASCLYTSFGYFDDKENFAFLRQVFSALKPGGKLVIDVINTARIRPGETIFMRRGDDYIADEVRIVAAGEYCFQRRFVINRQHYQREYTLRTYAPEAFTELFQSLGGKCRFYGDFNGESYRRHSKRMIVAVTAGSKHATDV
ncbi:cyclopropane-fatty-acyl-phospholipid synthase family protein [Serratia quinivorans]|uniref:cyclopropane-fatty-acyl-phospholipid synthase family protein n=1 Tax=Serratia quinivorans TaxID=137545 RepID=UPI0034C6D8E7